MGIFSRWIAAATFAAVAVLTPVGAMAESYSYDSLGRLVTVVTDDGRTISYAYDAAGNRTQVSLTAPAAPTVGNVSLSVPYNSAGVATLTPSGSYTTLAVAAAPGHGTASISGTTATYTPTSGYSGADSFTYTATGAGGTSAPGTVTVSVGAPAAPTVGNVSLTVAYNTAGTVSLAPSGSYTSLAVSTLPGHGTASISGTTATYTPTTGYFGADTFNYTASGPGGTSSPATVSVTVSTPPAPTVAARSLTVAYNTAGSVALSPSGVYTSLAVAGAPAHGTASVSGTTATYTPTTGYSGADSFTYTATGPGGTSAPAAVSVTVSPPASPLNVGLSAVFVSVNTATTATSGTTPGVTATASGGSGTGYVYLWQYVSGNTIIAATNPNGASTAWSRSLPGLSILYEAIWRCKVTDSAGTVVYSANVTVDLTRGPSP